MKNTKKAAAPKKVVAPKKATAPKKAAAPKKATTQKKAVAQPTNKAGIEKIMSQIIGGVDKFMSYKEMEGHSLHSLQFMDMAGNRICYDAFGNRVPCPR